MHIRFTAAIAAAFLAVASGTAIGQTQGTSVPSPKISDNAGAGAMYHEIQPGSLMIPGVNVTFADLREMDIYATDGNKVGKVDKVLADSSNSVRAVTVQVGGFLGVGAREAVIPIDRLQKGNEKDRLVTRMTKAEIQQLEEWTADYRGIAPMDKSGNSSPARTGD